MIHFGKAAVSDLMKADYGYGETAVALSYEQLQLIGWDKRKTPSAPAVSGIPRAFEATRQGEGWVFLDWKIPADGGAVVSYQVERRERPSDDWAIADMVIQTEPHSLSRPVIGLAAKCVGALRNTSLLTLFLAFLIAQAGTLAHAAVTDIQSGQTISGEISVIGEEDSYDFEGQAGDVAIITMTVTSGGMSQDLLVYDPDGEEIFGSTNDADNLSLPKTGTYTIVCRDSGNNDTGQYNVSLTRIPVPSIWPENSDCGTIVSGQTKSAEITIVSQSDTFTFSGDTGDVAIITMTVTLGGMSQDLLVYDPDGEEIFGSTNDADNLSLPKTGTYTIVCRDSGNNDTGQYDVSLTITPQNSGALRVTISPQGVIDKGAQWRMIGTSPWSGSGGTEIGIAAGSHTIEFSPVDGWITPSNQSVTIKIGHLTIASGSYTRKTGTVIVSVTPDTATWSFVGGDGENHSGSGDQTLFGVPTGQCELTWGEVIAYTQPSPNPDIQNLENNGEVSFNGVYVRQTGTVAVEVSPEGTSWTLSGPEGTLIIDRGTTNMLEMPTGEYMIEWIPEEGWQAFNLSSLTQQLVSAGFTTFSAEFRRTTHTLTVSAEHGSVDLEPHRDFYEFGTTVTLTAIPNAGLHFVGWTGDASGTDLEIVVTMNADKAVVANFAALATYTLTVNAENGTVAASPEGPVYVEGTTVTIEAIPATGYEFAGWTGVPAGSEMTNPLNITMDGNKVITAAFRAVTDIQSGQTISGEISVIGEEDSYDFEGQAGDVAIITMTVTSGDMSQDLLIYDPDGEEIFGSTNDADNLSLPKTGTYTIACMDSGNNDTGQYNVSLTRIPVPSIWPGNSDCGTIVSGQTKSAEITIVSQSDTFTFSDDPGNVAIISMTVTLGDMSQYLLVYDPDGKQIFDSISDADSLSLPTTGTYTIVCMDSGNNDTGQYSISLTIYRPEPPELPFEPAPYPGQTGVSKTSTLNWKSGQRTEWNEIYLWESDAAKPLSPMASITGEQFDLSFDLEEGTTYSWQVVAKNTWGETAGEEWRFSTSSDEAASAMSPTNVMASDGAFPDKILVTWSGGELAESTPRTAPLYFRVYRSTSASGPREKLGFWQTEMSYADSQITTSTAYYYWVKASNNTMGESASDFNAYDTGWMHGEADLKPYQITYKNSELEVRDDSTLRFRTWASSRTRVAAAGGKSTVKIKKLKSMPPDAVDAPGLKFVMAASIPEIAIVGDISKLYSEAPTRALTIDGELKKLTLKGAYAERLTAGTIGFVKMTAPPRAFGVITDAPQSLSETPVDISLPINATMIRSLDFASLRRSRVILKGIVLREFTAPGQKVDGITVMSQKVRDEADGQLYLNYGAMEGGRIEAQNIQSLSCKGGAIRSTEIIGYSRNKPMKINAKIGIFTLGRFGAKIADVRAGNLSPGLINVPAPALSLSATGGDIMPKKILASDRIQKMSAKFKKIRFEGAQRYYGGQFGMAEWNEAGEVLNRTTSTLVISGTDPLTTEADIRLVQGAKGVRGIFMAGGAIAPGSPHGYEPNMKGAIFKIKTKVPKHGQYAIPKTLGTGWSNQSIKYTPKGKPPEFVEYNQVPNN